MRKLKNTLPGVVALMLIVCGRAPSFAQSDAARLQGIITDQSSALVPDAKVTVIELSTNRTLETASAPDSGAWSFLVLPPGNYVIEVSKDGFKPIKQNVTLQGRAGCQRQFRAPNRLGLGATRGYCRRGIGG